VDLRDGELGELLPGEDTDAAAMRPERALEFRAGRHCARVAMARLGIPPAPILRAPDRSPVWPPPVTGSITHTRAEGASFCGAAVALTEHVRAVGIDVEPDVGLEEKLWRRVLTKSERAWLDTLPAADRGLAAKAVFSAKESTYKCQYVLSHQFLEFHDVEIAFEPALDRFTAVLQSGAAPFSAGHAFAGRSLRKHGLIATGVLIE
jgi:4'-phosphopantetheinyl transferase EntD